MPRGSEPIDNGVNDIAMGGKDFAPNRRNFYSDFVFR